MTTKAKHAHTARRPAGFDLGAPPTLPSNTHAGEPCPGCRRPGHQLTECAACGRAATCYTLADGLHSISWCERCLALLQALRTATAPPLDVFPLVRRARIARKGRAA